MCLSIPYEVCDSVSMKLSRFEETLAETQRVSNACPPLIRRSELFNMGRAAEGADMAKAAGKTSLSWQCVHRRIKSL